MKKAKQQQSKSVPTVKPIADPPEHADPESYLRSAIEKDGFRLIESFDLNPAALALAPNGKVYLYQDLSRRAGPNSEELDGFAEALRLYAVLHGVSNGGTTGEAFGDFLNRVAEQVQPKGGVELTQEQKNKKLFEALNL